MALGPSLALYVDVNVTLTGATPSKFSFQDMVGVFDHSVTANRVDGPYTSVAAAEGAGFTAAAEPEVHAWMQAVDQENGIDQFFIGREDAGDADMTATLTAVQAEVGAEAFYGLTVESRVEAEILLAAAFAEASAEETPKLFIAQSSDAAILAGTAGNVALDLQAASYVRTGLIYHRYDDSAGGAVPSDGYADGAWMGRCLGFNLDSANGAGTWKYKTLAGITADPLTDPQVTEIHDANANLYGVTKSLSFTSNGTTAQGRRLDVTTSLDWLRIRLGERILAEFVGEPNKIAFTNEGINRITSAGYEILEQGISNGILSGDADSLPVLRPPKASEVSTANKAARTLTIPGNAVLAGAIEMVTFNINVQE